MKITKMTANHFTCPVGCDLADLSLSYVVESAKARKQENARIVIALDPKFSAPVFDSGVRADIDSLSFNPAIKLSPMTRYFWSVSVTADNGEKATASSFFETGKMNGKIAGDWITSSFGPDAHFFVKKNFTVPAGAGNARGYVAALGMFEVEVNGKRITEELLLPGYHSYTCELQSQTFDVSEFLSEGENTIGFHVGPGWYGSCLGWGDGNKCGDKFGIRCEIRASFNGKNRVLAASDKSWECAVSPVVKSGIYYGEDYDARKEIENWSSPGCKSGTWSPAVEFTPDPGTTGKIRDRLSPPIRITEILEPAEIIKTPAGETVVDFGQNMTGWVSVMNRAANGEKWSFQFGELLQNGNFYRDNLRAAQAQYSYVSSGNVCTVRPHFTFYGFRYVKLNGFPENFNAADIRAFVIHSDIGFTGKIETSNPKINRLFLNARWGQRGNFLDVPTDCPQRDERLGWTGDTQVFSATACFNMDCASFYTKFMNDLILEQKIYKGGVPHTVPALLTWIKGGHDGNSAAWADVATVVPWTVYLRYGDKSLLRRMYPAMSSWVRFMKKQDDSNGGRRLRSGNFNFGDWLALDDHQDGRTCGGGTDKEYIASVYYAFSTSLALKAARVLGEKEDAKEFAKLLQEVNAAVVREYFTETGRCAVDTQTALCMALAMDVVPESFRKRISDRLVEKVKANGTALDTGFVGTPLLCAVLSDSGHSDVAYDLVTREQYPSWLYEVNLGATTIWERWHSVDESGRCTDTGMNSMNHYAYGAIVQWMYEHMCGLRPDESAVGFRRAVIQPEFSAKFKNVDMQFDSPCGTWKISWRVSGKKVAFKCTVPFGATALVKLPGMKNRRGKDVVSGSYKFSCPL